MNLRHAVYSVTVILLSFAICSTVLAENIDPDDDGARFAYGENVGWINADPANSGRAGIDVSASTLTGYLWAENIGWISLSCENDGSCAAVTYGVTNDGSGILGGYAWSENTGWISFSCKNTASCATVNYEVAIDPITGEFSGYAWGENIGWIKLDHAEAADRIRTALRDFDNDGVSDPDDRFPKDPNETSDNDGDGTGDNGDTDDDNDGTPDTSDDFPFDPSESTDSDHDGIGDNADTDDDNDGVPDADDAFPTDPSESSDADGDGIGDNVDTDYDNDGVDDDVEDAHPRNGDGNDDAIADSVQSHVASLPTADGASYVTLESQGGTTLSDCQIAGHLMPNDMLYAAFPYGLFEFTINGVEPGGSATLLLRFPADAELETYYKYGQTPEDPTDHWYEFLYDGETGAEVDNIRKTVTLHFLDAERGDDVLLQDSMVVDLGGPFADTRVGESDSGCFIGSLMD